jgi:prepilin-type N-terminal cleavage/methylation domain-containing protein
MRRVYGWIGDDEWHSIYMDDCIGKGRSDARAANNHRLSCRPVLLGPPMRLTKHGFTVVELLVATAIAGVAAALMTATIVRQQRFYSAAGEVLDVRSQMRDAADILASDIRAASVAMFGLPVMTDTAVEMLTAVATSVACVAPTGAAIGLPPSRLVTGNTLTSILAQPDTGDLALIYAIPSGSPDSATWEASRVASFTSSSLSVACPPSTGFTSSGDSFSGATGYQLTLAAAPSAGVRRGAPIHFLRRARYSLYRSSDGEWYLGYRRCAVASPFVCASIQPVSGPYRPYRASAAAGISFRYFDANGGELTSSLESVNVARIDIVLRGESSHAIALTGDTRRAWRDSVVVSVSPRNRKR